MKMRIKGNTLRLRLNQSEVIRFSETGRVDDAIVFPRGGGLNYSLLSGAVLEAVLDENNIIVTLPPELAEHWTASEDIAVEGWIPLGEGEKFWLLIEKDFKCLTERAQEDESDNFPNPNEEQGC